MSNLLSADDIRSRFSRAMSRMYQQEVPQYGTLLELVADVNSDTLAAQPALREQLAGADELDRLSVERHGAIRLGTADELSTMRRIFAVMGMFPVSYYDLSVAGLPVHATAFRPIDDAALAINPFRMFTSLLRLELLEDEGLRAEAAAILARRRIFNDDALALLAQCECDGGLDETAAERFVAAVQETFRWHDEATVSATTYQRLHDTHRLIADVVSFKGPHINHLTPRTLDIDAAQRAMPMRGISPKEVIEGPPPRRCPILLRQTSFKALDEPIHFAGAGEAGSHTARFGEIEQRGIALTRKGRALYDQLLADARRHANDASISYEAALGEAFGAFPDDWESLRKQELGFFRFQWAPGVTAAAHAGSDLDTLLADGHVVALPLVYEDFLPVSAAGIFRSNLGGGNQQDFESHAAQDAFEAALGAKVRDEFALYEAAQRASLQRLGVTGVGLQRH